MSKKININIIKEQNQKLVKEQEEDAVPMGFEPTNGMECMKMIDDFVEYQSKNPFANVMLALEQCDGMSEDQIAARAAQHWNASESAGHTKGVATDSQQDNRTNIGLGQSPDSAETCFDYFAENMGRTAAIFASAPTLITLGHLAFSGKAVAGIKGAGLGSKFGPVGIIQYLSHNMKLLVHGAGWEGLRNTVMARAKEEVKIVQRTLAQKGLKNIKTPAGIIAAGGAVVAGVFGYYHWSKEEDSADKTEAMSKAVEDTANWYTLQEMHQKTMKVVRMIPPINPESETVLGDPCSWATFGTSMVIFGGLYGMARFRAGGQAIFRSKEVLTKIQAFGRPLYESWPKYWDEFWATMKNLPKPAGVPAELMDDIIDVTAKLMALSGKQLNSDVAVKLRRELAELFKKVDDNPNIRGEVYDFMGLISREHVKARRGFWTSQNLRAASQGRTLFLKLGDQLTKFLSFIKSAPALAGVITALRKIRTKGTALADEAAETAAATGKVIDDIADGAKAYESTTRAANAAVLNVHYAIPFFKPLATSIDEVIAAAKSARDILRKELGEALNKMPGRGKNPDVKDAVVGRVPGERLVSTGKPGSLRVSAGGSRSAAQSGLVLKNADDLTDLVVAMVQNNQFRSIVANTVNKFLSIFSKKSGLDFKKTIAEALGISEKSYNYYVKNAAATGHRQMPNVFGPTWRESPQIMDALGDLNRAVAKQSEKAYGATNLTQTQLNWVIGSVGVAFVTGFGLHIYEAVEKKTIETGTEHHSWLENVPSESSILSKAFVSTYNAFFGQKRAKEFLDVHKKKAGQRQELGWDISKDKVISHTKGVLFANTRDVRAYALANKEFGNIILQLEEPGSFQDEDKSVTDHFRLPSGKKKTRKKRQVERVLVEVEKVLKNKIRQYSIQQMGDSKDPVGETVGENLFTTAYIHNNTQFRQRIRDALNGNVEDVHDIFRYHDGDEVSIEVYLSGTFPKSIRSKKSTGFEINVGDPKIKAKPDGNPVIEPKAGEGELPNLRIRKELEEWNLNSLTNLVSEMLNENYGQGYTPYPYHSHIGEEDEEAPDYVQDWKDFELSLVRDQSRNTAIELAKLLVRDLELFGDVVDLVGKNQSVGTEILKNFRKSERKT